MLRNNLKLRLPWSGKVEAEYDEQFIIRDSFGRVIAVVPSSIQKQTAVGNFMIRAANNKAIKDTMLDKLENIAVVFGLVTLMLMGVMFLVDIDYSPMLILAGGVLTTTSYIHLTRTKTKG